MTAIFLGKFQPPHLGHIQTILKISKKYEKVIIGITKGSQKILDYEEVKSIFEEIFENNKNIEVEIIEGTIEDGTAKLDSYNFDIIVTGNKKVLKLLSEKGYKTIFQARTEGVGYSGSEIRALAHNQNVISLEDKKNIFEFKILTMNEIKPLEKILPTHFKNIESMILKDGVLHKPLIIDRKYNIVLDGSHRYAFLQKYGYKYAPCLLVDYDDEAIFVGNHLKHRFIKDENFIISKSQIISRALSENLFAARTTRHFFPFRKVDYTILLDKLEKGNQKDISYLIENATINEEIEIDKQYIKEIEEEMNILENYIKEQKDVKKYLETQINLMQNME
ncbi:hypothetical protein EI285_09095 [Aliarcobacter skirrowii]|uniref:adenylyltransferase/cytidyltransferase family protein n=1 Tax=Aliarcobacter skirrowii TaxID=28200 RepID=UPI000F669C62|nr:adenylyltransferase/cytidyltransferase family protein [Aliarcobacter skirrowii]AZL54722.1 hypothetical protein EI285_09095 [Aliarcobacter skirrowii]